MLSIYLGKIFINLLTVMWEKLAQVKAIQTVLFNFCWISVLIRKKKITGRGSSVLLIFFFFAPLTKVLVTAAAKSRYFSETINTPCSSRIVTYFALLSKHGLTQPEQIWMNDAHKITGKKNVTAVASEQLWENTDPSTASYVVLSKYLKQPFRSKWPQTFGLKWTNNTRQGRIERG